MSLRRQIVQPAWSNPQVWVPALGAALLIGLFQLALLPLLLLPAMVLVDSTWFLALLLPLGVALPIASFQIVSTWLRRPLELASDGAHLLLARGGETHRVPLEGTTATWVGRTLVVRPETHPPVRVFVPGGREEAALVQRVIAELGISETPVVPDASVLEPAMTSQTHEGAVLELDPVFAPLPTEVVIGLVAAVGPVVWLVEMWFAFVVFDAHGWLLPVVLALPPLLLLGTWLVWELWWHQVGVVIRITSHRFEIEADYRLRTHRTAVPLADLRSVDLVGSDLVLDTPDGPVRVRLPGRSQRTRAALEAMLTDQRRAIADRQGSRADVPEPIRDLVGRVGDD